MKLGPRRDKQAGSGKQTDALWLTLHSFFAQVDSTCFPSISTAPSLLRAFSTAFPLLKILHKSLMPSGSKPFQEVVSPSWPFPFSPLALFRFIFPFNHFSSHLEFVPGSLKELCTVPPPGSVYLIFSSRAVMPSHLHGGHTLLILAGKRRPC